MSCREILCSTFPGRLAHGVEEDEEDEEGSDGNEATGRDDCAAPFFCCVPLFLAVSLSGVTRTPQMSSRDSRGKSDFFEGGA